VSSFCNSRCWVLSASLWLRAEACDAATPAHFGFDLCAVALFLPEHNWITTKDCQEIENSLRPQAQSSFLAILAVSALHSKRLEKCNQIALLFFR
jgi:hypothetical protein